MRFSWKTFAAVAVALVAAPLSATSEDADVQEQLRLMQERMQQLEQNLQATDEKIAEAKNEVREQQVRIEEAGIDRSGSSALSSFITQTVFDGFVAASYNYNFNDPSDSRIDRENGPYSDDGVSRGIFGNVAPYHGNANSFQVDQVWFGMEKAATAESRGGFRVDLVFGQTADVLTDYSNDGGGDFPTLYQAYAQYLAPITDNGISIKAGRYETVIGIESFKQNANFNVTRGIVWGIQPINHTGVLVEGDCGDCGIDWALGISNNFGRDNYDNDNSKTGLGRVRWTGDTASLAIAGLLGGNVDQSYFDDSPFSTVGSGGGRDADAIPMLDVVATWDPTESLSAWLNYTHVFNPINGDVQQDISMWGIAGAVRYAINDITGAAVRLEYLNLNSVLQGQGIDFDDDDDELSGDADMWSLTATLDRALTDHLTLKVEGRYDNQSVEGAPDDIFVSSCDTDHGASCGDGAIIDDDDDGYEHDDQFLALIHLLYEF